MYVITYEIVESIVVEAKKLVGGDSVDDLTLGVGSSVGLSVGGEVGGGVGLFDGEGVGLPVGWRKSRVGRH